MKTFEEFFKEKHGDLGELKWARPCERYDDILKRLMNTVGEYITEHKSSPSIDALTPVGGVCNKCGHITSLPCSSASDIVCGKCATGVYRLMYKLPEPEIDFSYSAKPIILRPITSRGDAEKLSRAILSEQRKADTKVNDLIRKFKEKLA